MVSAWRNFKDTFSRPLFTIVLGRCWVATIFTVWRMHSRTFIIVLHLLVHRISIFDDGTRTGTFPYCIKYIAPNLKAPNMVTTR